MAYADFHYAQIFPPTWVYPDNGSRVTVTCTSAPTLGQRQFAVMDLDGCSILSTHDTEKKAVAEARRLVEENGREYLVVKPIRLIREKPVDIEEVAL